MPVDRPTFSESWYRVASLRPRLRSTVQIFRQHYRGQMWHVLQDPSNNQFSRLNEAAYQFVALLDGQRTVSQVWDACNEEFGDAAPTQGEAVQLMGQLYTSNLIACELPPDAQGLFSRYRRRRQREVQGYLSNLLFIRIPLFDPDHILDRWVSVCGKLFTSYGLMLWMAIISTGLYFVVSNWSALYDQAQGVLEPGNLPLLYVSLIFIKVIHEFGHAFACKKFGQEAGGGEVHVMGVMFLVFTPLPYVDASSSWAFRNKWRRVTVGAAGMIVELAVAAIAAVIWSQTSAGTTIHAVTYNMMFIASVSTLLFNANPLLRYDGYYILSDLLEIPNLSQRAKNYLYYVVKKHVWSVRQARNPAHTRGEKAWFVFYGLASTCYRVFICARILLFIADKFFVVGAVLAVVALVVWVLVPLGKFAHYLATSGELIRTRGRAIATTLGTLLVIFSLIGVFPFPDRQRVVGVVEPVQMNAVFMETDGWVRSFTPHEAAVESGAPLLLAENPDLQAQRAQYLAVYSQTKIAREQALLERKINEYQKLTESLESQRERLRRADDDLAELTVRAKVSGVWIAPEVDRYEGAYVQRGEKLGLVASLADLVVRCTATQQVGPLLIAQAREGRLDAEIRVKGRPDPLIYAYTEPRDIWPAGESRLPSPALSYQAGGSMRTDMKDPQGSKAAEPFFEVRVHPNQRPQAHALRPGQRVMVRFDLPDKPLLAQWKRWLLQLIQRRFGG